MVFGVLGRRLGLTAQRGVRAFRAAAPRAATPGEAPIPAHMPEGIPVKARGIIDTHASSSTRLSAAHALEGLP